MPPLELPDLSSNEMTSELRRRAVMAALESVLDPELDESVTAMGFIESVMVDGGEVQVTFRLPTFWCSANFAFLMATDMRRAVGRLSFVERTIIRLVDHFAASKINRGVAAGLGFSAVFAGEAETDLDEIRRAFRERAFLGRQEKLLRLCAARWGVEAALRTKMIDLESLAQDEDEAVRAAAGRYIAIRSLDAPTGPEAMAFVKLDGTPIEAVDYPSHLRMIRRVRGAAEANAEMCRIYLQSRISHPVEGCGPEHREDDISA
jgi:metal-sulfur cluster biosynthetic enzyme